MQDRNCVPIWKDAKIMNLYKEQELVRKAMNATLSGLREDPYLKARILADAKQEKPVLKKLSVFAVTAALLVVSITAVLAAGLFSSIGQLYRLNGKPERDEITRNIQQVHERYEGNAACCELTGTVYDPAGGVYALSWTLTPLYEGDSLYVVLDSITMGGEPADTRSGIHATGYFLKKETDCSVAGELPESGGTECEITFSILRPSGEIVKVSAPDGEAGAETEKRYRNMLAAGQLPMEGDGWIYCHTGKGGENLSYSDQLLETGLMELTDRFTLKADIGTAGVHETRTYACQETFVSDGYEIRIRSCLVTPFTAKLEIECMTDTRPEDTANGTGTKLKLKVEVPGTEIWSRNQSLTQSCPVLMEDGRWSTLFALDAQALLVFPEAFRFTAGFHDGARFADCSGAVTIRLTDQ